MLMIYFLMIHNCFIFDRWRSVGIPPGGPEHLEGRGDKSGELRGRRAEAQRAGGNVGGAWRRGSGGWDR